MTDPAVQGFSGFIAIDIHKLYLMIGGIDAQQRIVLQPRKVELHRWLEWAQANLHPSDAVVLEATTNAWAISDQLVTLVGRVVVAHPAKVKLIADARVKTDRVDVLTLAKLLRADMLPEVWVPPTHVRDLRALLSHRRRLVALQTTAKNRLQSVLHRLNRTPPKGDLFAHKQRGWWNELERSTSERLRVDQDLATLAQVKTQIEAVDTELRRLSTSEEWAEQVPYLVQLPGIGLLTTMTVLGAVGDSTRFGSACALWSARPDWVRGYMRAARPTATRGLPNKAGASSALCCSKRRAQQSRRIRTGNRSISGWRGGSGKRRRWWRSRASC